MSYLVAFLCTGLLLYWLVRTFLLLRGPQDEIDEVLEQDLWWGYKVLIALRSLFIVPNQFAG